MFWIIYVPAIGFFWMLVAGEAYKKHEFSKLKVFGSWFDTLMCWFVTGWTPFIIAKFLN
jgi:hypothetical protein